LLLPSNFDVHTGGLRNVVRNAAGGEQTHKSPILTQEIEKVPNASFNSVDALNRLDTPNCRPKAKADTDRR
jgi:hypothetical protein